MLKKLLVLILLVNSYALLVTDCHAQSESITFTTYYPSPYGVYKILRIHPSSDCSPSGVCSREGEICYYSSAIVTERGLKVCSPDPANPNTLIWTALGGVGGGGWWTRTVTNTGANLYPNDPNWNVGIGTTVPAMKLQVNGQVAFQNEAANDYGALIVGGKGKALQAGQISDLYSAVDLYNVNNPSQTWGMMYRMSTGNFQLGFYGQTPAIDVTQSGNVGIGITSPQNRLDVEGGAVIGATYSGTNTAPNNGLLVQGNVGIGTTTPQAKLQVLGGVQIGTDTAPPSAAKAGTIRYNAGNIEYCNGASWLSIGGSVDCQFVYCSMCSTGPPCPSGYNFVTGNCGASTVNWNSMPNNAYTVTPSGSVYCGGANFVYVGSRCCRVQ